MGFMKAALEGKPVEDFANVEPLSKVALTKQIAVDTPDTAPTETEEPRQKLPAKTPPPKSPPGVSGGTAPAAETKPPPWP